MKKSLKVLLAVLLALGVVCAAGTVATAEGNGLYLVGDSTWMLYMDGLYADWYNGLYFDSNLGWWLLRDGIVWFDYTGLWNDPNCGWWLIGGGSVCFDYNGVWDDPNLGPWVISGGQPVEPALPAIADGLHDDGNGWHLYLNGEVATWYTGLYCDANVGWWLVENGAVSFGYTGLYGDANYGWWLVQNGAVNFGYTGLYCDANVGWWLIGGGSVCFDYNGVWNDPNLGSWVISGGRPIEPAVQADGLVCGDDGVWRLYLNGEFASGYTGLYCDQTYGWWLINCGIIAWDYTGLYNDANAGWWLINGGTIAWDYNALWDDQNVGHCLIRNGTIAFDYSGSFEDPVMGKCEIRDGMLVADKPKNDTIMHVAMITDYGDINDQSFNQATYEACKNFCENGNFMFQYYKPNSDSDTDRISCIEKAIDEGFNVIVLPGYAFGPAIQKVVPGHPDIAFIALDMSEGDLGDLASNIPSNLYCSEYREEVSSYMAGYAAVKLGYKKLGFLGGMAVPAIVRYGYGFIQGADDAATEIGASDVKIKYVYSNQFYGDADITSYMDSWYNSGTEIVFACGGGLFTSAGEAAAKAGGKVIGAEVDQAPTIDGMYGEGITVTSAIKGLATTVNAGLNSILNGEFAGGQIERLGLIGKDPTANFVQLAPSTQFAAGFTQDTYKSLVARIFSGEISVSDKISSEPTIKTVTVDYQGNIK